MNVNSAWKARLVYLVVVMAISSITAAPVWNIVSDSYQPSSAPFWAAFIFIFMMLSTGAAGAVLYGHALFETAPDRRQESNRRAIVSNEDWIAHAYPLQQVTIRLQGTRHSDKEAVISQLETVLARLKAGNTAGRDHDDDFGYAFEYVEAAPGPSFFEGPADTSLGKSTTGTPFNFEFDPRDNGHTMIFAPTRTAAER